MPHYPVVPVEQGMSYVHRAYAGSGEGQTQNKHRRFRRRYYQIYRKYKCSFTGCTKSYGSLNHLNTHIVTKKHGLRKSKHDFKNEEEEVEARKTMKKPEARLAPLLPQMLQPQTLAELPQQLRDITELETSTSEQSPSIMLPVQQQPSLWKSSPEILKRHIKGHYQCTLPTQEVGLRISRLLPPALAGHESIRLPLIPSIITRCDSSA